MDDRLGYAAAMTLLFTGALDAERPAAQQRVQLSPLTGRQPATAQSSKRKQALLRKSLARQSATPSDKEGGE